MKLYYSPGACSLSPFPDIKAFMDRVAARPKVQETLKREGLLQR